MCLLVFHISYPVKCPFMFFCPFSLLLFRILHMFWLLILYQLRMVCVSSISVWFVLFIFFDIFGAEIPNFSMINYVSIFSGSLLAFLCLPVFSFKDLLKFLHWPLTYKFLIHLKLICALSFSLRASPLQNYSSSFVICSLFWGLCSSM